MYAVLTWSVWWFVKKECDECDMLFIGIIWVLRFFFLSYVKRNEYKHSVTFINKRFA